jgi:hypothetical protein
MWMENRIVGPRDRGRLAKQPVEISALIIKVAQVVQVVHREYTTRFTRQCRDVNYGM